jgi:hypothetical protein
LEDNNESGTISVDQMIPLYGPDPNRCEKNWLPFIKDDQLHLIYSCDPFVLYKFNDDHCETVLSYEQNYDFTAFRGSASPIAFDNGYLMLVHETVQFPDLSRNYLHRFIFLDQNFLIKRLSKPFVFVHSGIEFCCSMVINHSETQLIMSIGVEDNLASLCFIDLETIRAMLTTQLTE